MNTSKLKTILKDHQLWLESGDKQGEHANLHGAWLLFLLFDFVEIK